MTKKIYRLRVRDNQAGTILVYTTSLREALEELARLKRDGDVYDHDLERIFVPVGSKRVLVDWLNANTPGTDNG